MKERTKTTNKLLSHLSVKQLKIAEHRKNTTSEPISGTEAANANDSLDDDSSSNNDDKTVAQCTGSTLIVTLLEAAMNNNQNFG